MGTVSRGDNEISPCGDVNSLAFPPTSKSDFTNWVNGLPDLLFELVFELLTGQDLMKCRMVCKHWETFCTPMLYEKAKLKFDGNKNSRSCKWFPSTFFRKCKTPVKRFISVIQTNPYWLSGWTSLKVLNAENSDIKAIFRTLFSSQDMTSFQNITSLQLSKSTMSWKNLLRLLGMLQNLEIFKDLGTVFAPNSYFFFKTVQTAVDIVCNRFSNFHFDKLVKLTIRRTGVGLSTLIYLKLIESCCPNLEEVEVTFETDRYTRFLQVEQRFDYFRIVGELMLRFWRTLKCFKFTWLGQRSFQLLDSFYYSLSDLETPLFLTNFSLNFECFYLGTTRFRECFIPFINNLKYLKSLSLKTIRLEPEYAELLELLQPDNINELETKISLGILLTDHQYSEFALENMNAIIERPILRSRIRIIHAIIISPLTPMVCDVLPVYVDDKFPDVEELVIFNQPTPYYKSQLISYNIDGLCETYAYLTHLTLLDGRRFDYQNVLKIHKQYDSMSKADVTDDDLQLILTFLTKLKRLWVRVRMDKLTDCGMTGLNPIACDRIIQDVEGQRVNCWDFYGVSFSNLKDLEEVVMKGLNTGISDVTAFYAFNNLPKLKILTLLGDYRITSLGKSYLRNMLQVTEPLVP